MNPKTYSIAWNFIKDKLQNFLLHMRCATSGQFIEMQKASEPCIYKVNYGAVAYLHQSNKEEEDVGVSSELFKQEQGKERDEVVFGSAVTKRKKKHKINICQFIPVIGTVDWGQIVSKFYDTTIYVVIY